MSNQNTPNGLRPDRRVDSAKWNAGARVYVVPATNTNALYPGDPVVKVPGSSANSAVAAVDLAQAGETGNVGYPITGAVVGFLGTAVANSTINVMNQPSFWPPSSTGGQIYRPAVTTLDYYVLVQDDPEVQFVIQVDGANTISATEIGQNFNLKAGVGNQIMGSGWTLDSTTASDNVYQVNLLGFDPQGANNDPTQPYAKAIVRLNTSTETNRSAGI